MECIPQEQKQQIISLLQQAQQPEEHVNNNKIYKIFNYYAFTKKRVRNIYLYICYVCIYIDDIFILLDSSSSR
jgi:NADH:ubiquinone oxidoreductase subunit E